MLYILVGEIEWCVYVMGQHNFSVGFFSSLSIWYTGNDHYLEIGMSIKNNTRNSTNFFTFNDI
jgi:hypothetical protein